MILRASTIMLAATSVGLFLLSLTQDGYYIDGTDPRAWAPAWGLLLFGWLGLFSGVFAWLANPLLVIGWILFIRRRYRAGLWTTIAALLFMLSFLLHTTIQSSEAPTYSKITGYGPGYWLWVASGASLLSSNVLAVTLRSSGPVQQRAAP